MLLVVLVLVLVLLLFLLLLQLLVVVVAVAVAVAALVFPSETVSVDESPPLAELLVWIAGRTARAEQHVPRFACPGGFIRSIASSAWCWSSFCRARVSCDFRVFECFGVC